MNARKKIIFMQIFVSLYSALMLEAMEEQKNNLLRKEDISDVFLREHWAGLEEDLSKEIARNKHNDGMIDVTRKKGLVGSYDIKNNTVVTYFQEGQLIIPYEEFKKKLENRDDEYNIGTIRGEQYIPTENGLKPGQRLSNEAKLNLYFALADRIGNEKQSQGQSCVDEGINHEHLQDSEDLALLKKRKKCCCILH